MSRSISSISRDQSFSTERQDKEPAWYKDLVANLEKSSVKSKRDDYNNSLYDQINAIVGDKASKFSSVEEKVSDMVQRVGLKKMIAQNANKDKQAIEAKAQLQPVDNTNKQVQTFATIPELKTFIDNYIEARPGTSIDAVIHDALKINQIKKKLPEGDDMPEEVKRYISFKIGEETKDTVAMHSNDNQLGKVDVSVDKNMTDDPLGICNPSRDGSS